MKSAAAMVSNVLQQTKQGKLEAVSWNEGSDQTTYSYPCNATHLVHLLTLTFWRCTSNIQTHEQCVNLHVHIVSVGSGSCYCSIHRG